MLKFGSSLEEEKERAKEKNRYWYGICRGWVKSFPKYFFLHAFPQNWAECWTLKKYDCFFLKALNFAEMLTLWFDAPIYVVNAGHSKRYQINNNIHFFLAYVALGGFQQLLMFSDFSWLLKTKGCMKLLPLYCFFLLCFSLIKEDHDIQPTSCLCL